ncbi:N-acetylmuramoyl-L-alanine amidase family protein [Anaerorudis cellulosivorans]|uniref:N-acetylmuramoyl-L-alanine amidase family protein n=1 Tax=Anaerorudis cellulosivorans TaxID=3397862 RepID=UPI00221F9F9E|nr:N-acetylmuramoyl-L-alanine amidase [Seramator thermalis]MCW1734636.1 N-acetylmuramoyl-L-alanine amidase [Seramator thermalis]
MSRYFEVLFLLIFAGLLFPVFPVASQQKEFTVVIDAGHGGKDPGALGSSSREKDITLSVAKKLGALIEKKHPDVKVVYTRKDDSFVALDRRADIANSAKADLFISIHCNALSKRQQSPQGVETFILGLHRSKDNLEVAKKENSVILLEEDYSQKYEGFNPQEPESYIIFEFMSDQYLKQSLRLASLVQHQLVHNSNRINRDVRQAGFLVLREVAMPSILVELGYISNPNDEKYLKSTAGQNSMANSIYMAFKEYKRDYDKKNRIFSNETTNQHQKTISSETAIEYRVQFLTSPKKYEAGSPAFKGLSPVSFYKDGTVYKYTYGSATDLSEIIKILNEVQPKFKDAFIVKFQNGIRIQ